MWQYRLSENYWSAREDRSAVLGLRHWVRQVPIGSPLNYIGQGSRQAPYYISEASDRSSVGALSTFWHQSSSFYNYSQAVTLISIFKDFYLALINVFCFRSVRYTI